MEVGLTIVEAPFPIATPAPQPPAYQYQSAPVPKNPPDTARVVGDPAHTVGLVAVTVVASVEFVFTVIVNAATADVSQPSART